jgi:hypothetical protein
MNELTLLDRYVIYSEMILLHEREIVQSGNYSNMGLCNSLSELDLSLPYSAVNINIDNLPELVKYKPKRYDEGNNRWYPYWFSYRDQKRRIRILKKCIKSVVEQMEYDFDNDY